jgi:acyl carrier protein
MWRSASQILRVSNFRTMPIRMFGETYSSIETFLIEKLKSVDGVNPEKVLPTSSFKEIELDSLNQIELISTIEEHYKITLNDDEAQELQAIPDLAKIILSKLS